MQERYFHVVIKVPNGIHTRQLIMENGEMFNSWELEQTVIDDIRKKGLKVDSATVIDWKEFKSESDFQQFIKVPSKI
ncbi:MAG: hypothetical protein J6N72_07895 [Psychrobacter sp.]|nr:hypothetical protein [Psychrobacter sp.]